MQKAKCFKAHNTKETQTRARQGNKMSSKTMNTGIKDYRGNP